MAASDKCRSKLSTKPARGASDEDMQLHIGSGALGAQRKLALAAAAISAAATSSAAITGCLLRDA